MNNTLTIVPIIGIPQVKPTDDFAIILIKTIKSSAIGLRAGDIICVASKVLSISENRFINLNSLKVSSEAATLHKKLPNKDPRILQLILDQADNDESNLRVNGSWIGAKNHVGRLLTSAGIDKVNNDTVLLLPQQPDNSARAIGEEIESAFDAKIGIIITDSDGREGIAGATQICIGLYGVPPLRERFDSQETVCDMLAAAAGISMGQRGNNIPAVIIRGYQYDFNKNAHLRDAY